jgi:hypothetical protein
MKKITIKKAQSGVKVDKTSVRKTDATRQMKGDNEIAVRKQQNESKLRSNLRDKSVSAAMMYGDKDGSLIKDAAKQDSLSSSATKKAAYLKKNPKFPVKKSGGKITKKK